jgi:hypothetical protein
MTELSEFPVHISSILGAVVHSGPKRIEQLMGPKNMGMGMGIKWRRESQQKLQ